MRGRLAAEGPDPQRPAAGPGRGAPRTARWLFGAAALLAALLVGVVMLGRASGGGASAAAGGGGGHVVTRQQLQDEYGIRLNLVGVTAAGGLVDLRFTITDLAKAKKIFTDPGVMPAVVAERTGTVLQAPHGGHHGHITPIGGASYFVLIGNAGGVVQRGVPVSVLINGVRVEHIRAET